MTIPNPLALRPALALRGLQLAPAPWVEAAVQRQTVLDRALLRLLGRAAVWLSPWQLRGLRCFAQAVLRRQPELAVLDDSMLRQRAAAVSAQLRRRGLEAGPVIECFALVREVSARRLGKCHHPVQLMGGRAILDGEMAEMHTGEGKTLTALLPAVTMALAGVPVHVITVNAYLAARDAQLLEPVFAFFGLSVGQVLPGQTSVQRRQAYRCDVAYCVDKDLAFDYLRDRVEVLAGRLGARAQVGALAASAATPAMHGSRSGAVTAGLWFAIVDEADCVFIDEARTPLIISRHGDSVPQHAQLDAALAVARELQAGRHHRLSPRTRSAALTAAGRRRLADLAHPDLPAAVVERERLLEQALAALHCHERDRHYILGGGKVQIVDENTGRVMPDRTWEGGLHALVERKEGLAPSEDRDTLARITYQRMFCRYLRVGGMSGTLREVAGELKEVLGTGTVCIPTHRPVQRRQLRTQLFRDGDRRDAAVVAAAQGEVGRGRAVLIGTRSVAASQRLAALCTAAGLAPRVLNARQDQDEAAVLAQAGQPGSVTVATNMAGRGTDILLHEAVRRAGGLHVVLTAFHDSRRIDRQLFGRAGRQGDPGSCEALVALDDELFIEHAPRLRRWLGSLARACAWTRLPGPAAALLRSAAQWAAESHHTQVRRHALAQETQTDRMLAFAGQPE